MSKSLFERAVALSIRGPWFVIIVATLLTLLCIYITATRFSINTDTARLISPDVPWRQDEMTLNSAFPQRWDVIVAVIDGATPEIADEGAEKLAAALKPRTEFFRSVRRPDGDPFFAKNGLLLLSKDALTQTIEDLTRQQPLLGPLAADPSLRGVMETVSLGLQGVDAGETTLGSLAGPLGAMSDVFERVLAGQPARLSWQTLLEGGKPNPRELRRFLLIQPKLDFHALLPGAAATDAIRRSVVDLGLVPGSGVRVRLTGPVPISDEEFASLTENVTLNTTLTLAAIALILYLALRSGRVILAVLATLVAGLAITAGVGLLVVHQFNLISVAFAALFVGLGVDFAIQFAIRYRAERYTRDDLPGALRAAAQGVGGSLTLAAISLLAGFFSFLPTEFRGVSELGLIAGIGMVIAYVASLTLLPALIMVLRPPRELAPVETAPLAAVDHWIARHRRLVSIGAVLTATAGLPFLVRMPFDSNPMDLRNKHTESVSTFLELEHDPNVNPYTIDILAPSLEDAQALSAKLTPLPEVERTVTLASFIPADQDEKLSMIRDAAMLLEPVIHPTQIAPPPTDGENVASLHATAERLRDVAGRQEGAGADTARRLASLLDRLAAGNPGLRAAAQTAVTTDLNRLLDRLRLLMSAEPITRENLPPDLVADWVAPDGRARVEVYPKGDTDDNAALARFANAVRAIAPHATGTPVIIVEAGHTVVRSFVEAGALALVAIFVILVVALRRPLDVALTLGPLVLATIMTLEAASLLGLAINYANIIALPLMLAIGVAFHIYYVIAWRAGLADVLASSLTRAIFFSALTTGAAFGSLSLSSHPGTASMGKLLALSLFFTLLAAFIIVPAFLGPPRAARQGSSGTEPTN